MSQLLVCVLIKFFIIQAFNWPLRHSYPHLLKFQFPDTHKKSALGGLFSLSHRMLAQSYYCSDQWLL